MNDIVETLKCFVAKRASTVLTQTGIPRLDILRVASPTSLFPEVYQPLVSLILQGQKRLVIGDQLITYGAGDTFIASIDLPVIGEITTASPKAPYLAVRLTFDRAVIAALLRDDPTAVSPGDERRFCVDRASDTLADAWLRMLRLMDEPTEIDVMAPMLEREIMFRLLRGPQSAVIRQVAAMDGRVSQVRQALAWIREKYASLAALGRFAPTHPMAEATSCLSASRVFHERVGAFDTRRGQTSHSACVLTEQHLMIVFDIPYRPPAGHWTLHSSSGQAHAFDARHDAVKFAAQEASRLGGIRNGAYLSIEGADGKWRLFGPDLKAPVD